jgi:hypothetical protein
MKLKITSSNTNHLGYFFHEKKDISDMDLTSIMSVVDFMNSKYDNLVIEFTDDIFFRKDYKGIIKTLRNFKNIPICLNVHLDNYEKMIESIQTNLYPIIILPTTEYSIYKTIYINSKLTETKFNELMTELTRQRLVVKCELSKLNEKAVVNLCETLKTQSIIVGTPLIETTRTYNSVKHNILPTEELIQLITLLNNTKFENCTIWDIPKCIYINAQNTNLTYEVSPLEDTVVLNAKELKPNSQAQVSQYRHGTCVNCNHFCRGRYIYHTETEIKEALDVRFKS